MRRYGCYHEGKTVLPDCTSCRDKFELATSYCGFCARPVSNKIYLSGDYHQSGKCRSRLKYKEPERTVDKPLPYPMPGKPVNKVFSSYGGYGRDGDADPVINSWHDLAVWWRLVEPKEKEGD